MAALNQIFIHSAAVSVPVVPDLESYRWSDSTLPSLVGVKAILAEVPPEAEVSADLLREIQFAGEAGAQVVWLITAQSSEPILEALLSVSPFALRNDGLPQTLTVTSTEFAEYFTNLDGYHFVFHPPQGFDTVATVIGSTVAVAVARQAPSAPCTAFLPFPTTPSAPAVSVYRRGGESVSAL
jgi:hypothetical protein